MESLRLLADDLTGALDTSAEFVGACGPLDVLWSRDLRDARERSLAIDSGTRELGSGQAFVITREIAPFLSDGAIAYKKVDSRLRGPWAAELDACMQTGAWDACIVAPAFPHQGRVTRGGKQFVRANDGVWSEVADLVGSLRDRKLHGQVAKPESPLREGINIFDAVTDQDLDRIAEIGQRFSGRLLWCGSGGLASALTRGTEVSVAPVLKPPVLGLFGSDHAVTSAQVAACGTIAIQTADVARDIDRIKSLLARGVAFVRLETPSASSRANAAWHFSREIAALTQAIEAPGTLIVAGGETLKAQMLAVEAHALQVAGRLEPGLPKSVIKGGHWEGVDVISKSGAFGPPDLWLKLLRSNGLA